MSDATERWAPVLGFEGYYEVSDLGRVRTVERVASRMDRWGNQSTIRIPGRIRRAHHRPLDGRPVLTLTAGGQKRTRLLYALVLEAFVGPCPAGMEACHNDGDASNSALTNLRWDTHSSNMYDRGRHGTDPKRNRTHCPRGHILSMPNLDASRLARGHRSCLACSRVRKALWKAKMRGVPLPDMQKASDERYARIMA